MKALLIEDEPAIGRVIKGLLEQEGFSVQIARTGAEGQQLGLSQTFDAIVLDQGLPDRNGITIVEAIRMAGLATPVIVLSGWSDSISTIRALDAGADDYLKKPMPADEFRARIRALVRRGGARQPGPLTAGNLSLDRHRRRLSSRGSEVPITEKELAVLEQLMLQKGRAIASAALLEAVWNRKKDVDSNVVNVTVTRLRKKLARQETGVIIESRRGFGFVLRVGGD
ncbi:MAG: response regulator transcription factor [Gemmatimonadota bacterium]|nr:response regulator transcription factor [Gemmatimonadota bacterium]